MYCFYRAGEPSLLDEDGNEIQLDDRKDELHESSDRKDELHESLDLHESLTPPTDNPQPAR